MSQVNVLIRAGGPQVEVVPEKASAFITRVQAGEEVTSAARAEGLSRADLASTSFKAAVERLLPFVPTSPTEGRNVVLAALYEMLLTSTDDRTRLGAVDRLQKAPELGFMQDGPVVEVSVLSPEIKALPLPEALRPASEKVIDALSKKE